MSKGTDVFEYVAFELILQKLAHMYGTKRFGFPYIGMGLAGGDKITIMAMLETFAREVTNQGGSVTLVEFS
jgi:2-oxo-4-hydroxy-4-carboxy--5-ureidoimidazoline (OHCU) decarboxylase